jgi:hypothetical protein
VKLSPMDGLYIGQSIACMLFIDSLYNAWPNAGFVQHRGGRCDREGEQRLLIRSTTPVRGSDCRSTDATRPLDAFV